MPPSHYPVLQLYFKDKAKNNIVKNCKMIKSYMESLTFSYSALVHVSIKQAGILIKPAIW